MHADLGEEGVKDGDDHNDKNGNATLLPLGGDMVGGQQHVGGEDDTSRSWPLFSVSRPTFPSSRTLDDAPVKPNRTA